MPPDSTERYARGFEEGLMMLWSPMPDDATDDTTDDT
jgi:hypothetical protein